MTGIVELYSEEIEMLYSRFEDLHIRCKSVEVRDHLVGPEPLAAIHIVAGSSYCKHYVVEDLLCNTKRIHSVRKRKLQIVVGSEVEFAGFGTLQMDFEWTELVGRRHQMA